MHKHVYMVDTRGSTISRSSVHSTASVRRLPSFNFTVLNKEKGFKTSFASFLIYSSDVEILTQDLPQA